MSDVKSTDIKHKMQAKRQASCTRPTIF